MVVKYKTQKVGASIARPRDLYNVCCYPRAVNDRPCKFFNYSLPYI